MLGAPGYTQPGPIFQRHSGSSGLQGLSEQEEFPKKAAQGVSVPMASSQGLSAETGGVGLGDASEVQVSRLIVGLKSHCSVTLWGIKESTTQF